MYTLFPKKKFIKSLERLRRGRAWNENKTRATLELLASVSMLPAVFKEHQLKGELSEYQECHIKHDLLLVYLRDKRTRTLYLHDIGTHDDLFGS